MAYNEHDPIEDSLTRQKTRLLNDIIQHDSEFYLKFASNSSKEKLIKEGIVLMLDGLMESLNNKFKDVHFQYRWERIGGPLDNQMRSVSLEIYDQDYHDDEDYQDDPYRENSDNAMLFNRELNEIDIKLQYFWERTCSLGCKHKTKRYYIYNIPKLMDMLTYWKVGAPVEKIVAEYIPDFFYDPMNPPKPKRKRGRPRKDAHS